MSKYRFNKVISYFENIPEEKYTYDVSLRIEPIQTLFLSNLTLQYNFASILHDFGNLKEDSEQFNKYNIAEGKDLKHWLLSYLKHLKAKHFKNKLETLIE